MANPFAPVMHPLNTPYCQPALLLHGGAGIRTVFDERCLVGW
jgi:hypothetical protein